jgi:hypothetical protein
MTRRPTPSPSSPADPPTSTPHLMPHLAWRRAAGRAGTPRAPASPCPSRCLKPRTPSHGRRPWQQRPPSSRHYSPTSSSSSSIAQEGR